MRARMRLGLRRRTWLGASAALGSVAVLIAVEAVLLAPGHTLAADIASAALVFILLNGALIASRSEWSPQAWLAARALQAVALVALVRVVGFGLPLRDVSAATGMLVVAGMIGLVTAWAAPKLGVPLRPLLTFESTWDQGRPAVAGALLGLAAYLIGAHPLWARGADGGQIGVALLALCVASVTEELLFRGVVQSTLWRSAGRIGLLAASALYAATYVDVGSAALVLTVVLAGLIFSYTVASTGSLTGAVAGHALFALGAGGLWATILGRREHMWVHGTVPTVVVGVGVAVMTVIIFRTSR